MPPPIASQDDLRTALQTALETAYDSDKHQFVLSTDFGGDQALDVGPVLTLLSRLIGGPDPVSLVLQGVEEGVQVPKSGDDIRFFIVGTLATAPSFLPTVHGKKAIASFTYDVKAKGVAVDVGIGYREDSGSDTTPDNYAFAIGASYGSAKKKKSVKGTLRIDENDFEADFEKDDTSKRVTLKWAGAASDSKAEAATHLDLASLVSPFGLDPVDQGSELELGLTSASVTYEIDAAKENGEEGEGVDAPEGDGAPEEASEHDGAPEDEGASEGNDPGEGKKESSREFVLTGTSETYGGAVFIISKVPPEKPDDATAEEGASDAEPKTAYTMLFGGGPDNVLSVSNLPLVGEKLASLETMEVSKMRLMVTSQPISEAAVKLINAIIESVEPDEGTEKKEAARNEAKSSGEDDSKSGTLPTLPETGLKATVGVGADLRFGDVTIPISLGFGKPGESSSKSTAETTSVGKSKGDVKTTEPKDSDGTAWFHLQKTIGPVTFDKVGVRYQDKALTVALNASMALGGVTVSLDGLSMSAPLRGLKPVFGSGGGPSFNLEGLGVDFKKPPLNIGGALLHQKNPPANVKWEYDGDAIVTVPGFSLSAVGSYAKLTDGQPSLFFFAELDAELGGPSFFFITGLKGGFGYNSQLQIPEPKDVKDFPLLTGLSGSTPMEVLKNLEGGDHPAVVPTAGETWLAAGINFTTEELVDTKALVIVEFGKDLIISLLGLSDALFPKSGPEKGKYARIELGLEALIKPNDGVFLVAAELTKNSYVIDPSAHLTGGFAFEVWFGKNPHAGDFVITLGGYNNHFGPPEWYPQEPRLGLNWAISSTVGITGESYFALTPSALMAGGRLDVEFHSGNLRAWLKAYADLLIRWKPFFFEAGVGVNVGVSYKLNLLFTSVTLRVSLGAELKLHGPPTGGTATVHWYVISFTIPFGSDRRDQQGAHLKWGEFTSLIEKETPQSAVRAEDEAPALDASGVKALSIAATKGRMQRQYSGDGAPPDDAPWAVRGHNFTFSAVSKIPVSSVTVSSSSDTPPGTIPPVNIRPMGLEGVASALTVEVTLDGGVHSGWSATWLHRDVPKALWGEKQSPTGAPPLEPGSKQLVPNALIGVSLQSPAPETGDSPGPIDVKTALGYDVLQQQEGTQPLPDDTADGPAPQAPGDVVSRIAQINDEAPRGQRDALADVLGRPPSDLSRLAARAGHLYVDEPMVLPSPSDAGGA